MVPILGNELLRGERVYLNRIARDDLPALVAMFSDVEFARHLRRNEVELVTADQMEEWYREMNREHAEPTFAIRPLGSAQIIGAIGFKDLRWASRHTFFWVGIGLPEFRQQGFGTDATRVLLKFAFMDLNLNCVGLEVMAYNERAIAAYRKVGFRHDGSIRAYVFRDGVYYDLHFMSMLREEWEKRYGEEARRPLKRAGKGEEPVAPDGRPAK